MTSSFATSARGGTLRPSAATGGAIPILFAHYGEENIRGSERILLDLLRHLDREAVEPIVWCNTETMAAATRDLGVRTYMSRMPLLLGWDKPRLDVRQYRELRRTALALFDRHAIRVVHANSGAPNQWLVPAARSRRIGLVAHLHAHYVLRDRCTLLLHRAPIVVGCTEAVINPLALDGVSRDRLRVIRNGVDVDRLERGDATGLRAALQIDASETVVACVGALIPLKGFDLAIRAAAELMSRGACPTFLIIGRGPEDRALRELATALGVAGKVKFLGARDDVGAILRDACDVVLVPSRLEAFGLTVAEAGMFGIPAIASDAPGLRETIIDGVTGRLVEGESPIAIADALEQYCRDSRLRRDAGRRARAHAREHFTIGTMVEQFASLYGQLASNAMPTIAGAEANWMPWRKLGATWIGNRVRRIVRQPA